MNSYRIYYRRVAILTFIMFLTFGLVRLAQALPYEFELGSGSWINTTGTNSALQLYAIVNPDLDNISFSLSEGESSSFKFATVGTTESWINDDDLKPKTITAHLDFDSPDHVSDIISGTSVGYTGILSFTQGWNLKWNDPILVETNDGLKFSIDFTDVGYYSLLWQGPSSSADVYAKIKLISEPNSNSDPPRSVPDADIMWLLGPAFIALGLLGRKKLYK